MPTDLPTLAAARTLRPGERLVAGVPLIFDLDTLNQHCAREALLAAPADLSALSRDALDALSYKATAVIWRKDDARTHPEMERLQVIRITPGLLETAFAVLAAKAQVEFAERERAAVALVVAA